MNMQRTAEDNFCNEHGKVQKPVTAKDYSWLMSYIDRGDRMASSYSNSQTLK
jgi:hypothetical protein